jgi:hypothetical protein
LLVLLASSYGVTQNTQFHSKVDLQNIPVRLNLEDGFEKAELNKSTAVVVNLKDSHGATVAALRDEKIQVHFEQKVMDGIIPAGKDSTTFHITPTKGGTEKIEVTGSDLGTASGFVLAVDPSRQMHLQSSRVSVTPGIFHAKIRPTMAEGSMAAAHTQILEKNSAVMSETMKAAGAGVPATEASATGGPAASPTAATLKVLIQPDPVSPEPDSGLWKAQIAVALVGKENELIAADRDLRLHLMTQKGQVSPANLVMKKDQSLTEPATLTSRQSGADVIAVLSPLPGIQQSVTYQTPEAAELRLEVSPASVIDDGKSPVRLVIMLADSNHIMVNAARNTDVLLSSDKGSISPGKVTIPVGECCVEAVLTSMRHGTATVSAEGAALKRAQAVAVFLFPWMIVVMAAIGGILGALVQSGKVTFTAAWLRHVMPSLVLGLIFGVIFAVAALFGAIGALPKLGLPVQINQIPSANELGALLLGFVGGFYGKKVWLKGDSDEGEDQKGKAAGQKA